MDALKLIAVTLGFLIVIAGFFFVAFSLSKKKNVSNCDSNANSSSFGCGCGSGACGLPTQE
jgi:hypothetical protein